jgi:hypothetical protein
MGVDMKRFLVIAEVKIDQAVYDQVIEWGVEPSDYISSILCDHARDRGLIIKATTSETDYMLYDDVIKSAEAIEKDKAFNELESEIISHACINGNCED